MEKRKYGFVSFWKHNDKWYTASEEEKQMLIDRVNEISREASAAGVEMSSVYDCSWSSEWRYFSFWQCPDIKVLLETMEKLQECGDINLYNLQHHYVGVEVRDNDRIDIYDPHYFNKVIKDEN